MAPRASCMTGHRGCLLQSARHLCTSKQGDRYVSPFRTEEDQKPFIHCSIMPGKCRSLVRCHRWIFFFSSLHSSSESGMFRERPFSTFHTISSVICHCARFLKYCAFADFRCVCPLITITVLGVGNFPFGWIIFRLSELIHAGLLRSLDFLLVFFRATLTCTVLCSRS